MKVLVVGGSGGIGAAIVGLLSRDGHELAFTYHNNSEASAALEKETGAKKIRYDFSSKSSVSELVEQVGSGSFGGLVYAAAEKFQRQTLLQTEAEIFLRYLEHSVDGYYQVSRAFALSCKKRGSPGVIVNVLSSVVFGLPPAKQASYVSAKYALWGLTRCQAVEFGAFGVRVNAISPGMTQTKFNSDLPERFLEIYAESLPLRRLLTPEEVAREVIFLLSSGSSDLQGSNLPVTGSGRNEVSG